jgi:hypothetical protein
MASSKKKQPPRTGLRSRKVQGFGALLVAAAVASGAVAWSLSGSDDKTAAASSNPTPAPKTEGDKYAEAILADFGTMSSSLVSYLQTLQKWRDGKVEDAAMGAQATNMIANIADAQKALEAHLPFDQAPRAVLDYRLAADGYAQSAVLTKVATTMPKGPLRTQVTLAVMRVQTLSDRIFDQGKAELQRYLTPDQNIPGVEVHKAPEVPNWAAGNYAPGPPLAAVGGDKTQRDYQDTRPTQSFAAWKKLVTGAGLPSAQDEATAISNGNKAALRSQAVTFTKAADLLYGKPDPIGERVVSTRLQLGLLFDAEAVQVAQAAALAPAAHHDALLTAAKSLAVIGDKLWDARLGERSTGFPDSLLLTLPSPTPTP